METRFCIEYVNPRHPLRDNGSINVRYDRVLTLEQAENDLTLILSFGGKIIDLYMGNVVDGKTGEWSPKPMIVDDDDWFTTDWLKSLESKWKPSTEQIKYLTDVVDNAKYRNKISTNRYKPYMYLSTLLQQLKKLRGE